MEKIDPSLRLREHTWVHIESTIRILLRAGVSLSLLAGGIIMLALRISGWSIIFGLPMVVFGAVFIIYTYDEVLSRHPDSQEE